MKMVGVEWGGPVAPTAFQQLKSLWITAAAIAFNLLPVVIMDAATPKWGKGEGSPAWDINAGATNKLFCGTRFDILCRTSHPFGCSSVPTALWLATPLQMEAAWRNVMGML
jgi:hypothetical protein